MHDVPRESVGEHTGIYKDDGLTRDELDEQLARKSIQIPPFTKPSTN